MKSSSSLRRLDSVIKSNETSLQWVIGLDRHLKVVSAGDNSPFGGQGQASLVGRNLEQIGALGHFHALLAKGFGFKSVPVPLDDRWYVAEYLPGGADGTLSGGELVLTALDRGNEAVMTLHDFVQSIDPFSLDAGGGILLVDRAGFVLMVNREFADILGMQVVEMVGRHVNEAYPDSTLSRLPKVMDSGKAEIGEPHQLNGRQIIASRWPLIKNGKTFGAYGKIQLREGPGISRLSGNFPSLEGKSSRRAIAGHRPTALYNVEQIVCHGQTMRDLKERLVRIADRSSTVLLTGESGTGKELFAHAIHSASRRCDGPFVRVNCAAIPENLLEAELFGYVEGAFSGARRGGQIGKFEQAHGGTLFLDEISEMPLSMQAKLLRVLQEREVAPLGSQDIRFVDVRFVTATNCDALALVKEGRLRSDLYYRINVVALPIPSLRERPEDVFYLTRHFVELFNAEFDLNVQGLSSRAWAALKAYPFPGNVRELRSAIESAFNMVNGPFIRLYDLPAPIAELHRSDEPAVFGSGVFSLDAVKDLGTRSLQEIMEEIEKDLILGAMEKVGGNKLVAANLLGISRPGLYKKLQKYNLH
ncbi:MAG: sigma 54-interacting transcriptional regulator [Desulfuromonadales bacterium]|nr:sigma 54-interacting transcriptional regulator [Desulfuromonadales bacterium]